MPEYTDDELDDLEEAADSATADEQSEALASVAAILESNHIAYGVMGGMNFYLRGSGRTTSDVDIAVDNPPRMDALLRIFNNNPRIYRPSNRMQWVSGVARTFVDVRGQMVQIDLKPKGAEGHMIPRDLSAAVERFTVNFRRVTFDCNLLKVGPLVAAKIKSYYSRETRADYTDLTFVCLSPIFAPQVAEVSEFAFRREWKEFFLEAAGNEEAAVERQIRWALNMPPTPSKTG